VSTTLVVNLAPAVRGVSDTCHQFIAEVSGKFITSIADTGDKKKWKTFHNASPFKDTKGKTHAYCVHLNSIQTKERKNAHFSIFLLIPG